MNPNIPRYGPEYERYKVWQAINCLREDMINTNTFISNSVQNITVANFSDLQAYAFSSQPLRINVVDDEDKGQQNTAYYWTGSVLKWAAEVEDDFQPTVN